MTRRIDLRFSCGLLGWGGRLVGVGLLGGVLGLTGCGGSPGSAPTNTTPQVVVSGGGQVRLGSTAQLTATVTNEPSTAVTWQVNGVTGGSSTVGTISTTGLYTPPTTIPTQNVVTITAVSVSAPTLPGTASDTGLTPPPLLPTPPLPPHFRPT